MSGIGGSGWSNGGSKLSSTFPGISNAGSLFMERPASPEPTAGREIPRTSPTPTPIVVRSPVRNESTAPDDSLSTGSVSAKTFAPKAVEAQAARPTPPKARGRQVLATLAGLVKRNRAG